MSLAARSGLSLQSTNFNHVRNGTAAMLTAYTKYHLKPAQGTPKAFIAEIQKCQDGSAMTVPNRGLSYLVSTSIGGQTLTLDFDTGSADCVWLFSSLLPGALLHKHAIYRPIKSSTYESLLNYTSYSNNEKPSGKLCTDTVVIGGTTVRGQAVELAIKVDDPDEDLDTDGIVGWAFSNLNCGKLSNWKSRLIYPVPPKQQLAFFANAKSSLNFLVFAAYLPYNASGAYDFGYTDSSKFTSSLNYTAVDSSNSF
ncbi:acid protease [Stipitochalara longipes BDJ]|nr:acid protease [Stipitochalara longipes BDJ]